VFRIIFFDVAFHIVSHVVLIPVLMHCSRLMSNNKRFTYLLTYLCFAVEQAGSGCQHSSHSEHTSKYR